MSTQSLRLQNRSEDLSDLIDQDKKQSTAEENIVKNAQKIIINYQFYCDICLEDFEAVAMFYSHSLAGKKIAMYRGKCVCGKEAIRFITDKNDDPYYQKSATIRYQRNKYHTDILQQGQYGYKTHYGSPWENLDKRIETENDILRGRQKELGFNL